MSPPTSTRSAMLHVAGGDFLMGSNAFYPDEGPVHPVHVDPFELDWHPVTNAQFSEFVAETGYVTTAERPLDGAEFAGLLPEARQPGSLVFTPTAGPVDLSDWRQWWRWVPGADWRHPSGPESGLRDRWSHPVVQVSQDDARAYADWVGGRLPTEAEWEFAAKWGTGADWPYAWGHGFRPDGTVMANTWQGAFPYRNTGADGWVGTSPVGAFPPNLLGLLDMIGNVWEWTSTPYRGRHDEQHADDTAHQCAGHEGDHGHGHGHGHDDAGGSTSTCACGPSAAEDADQFVLKGGSHLCAPEYCLRYRPAARSPQSPDSATTHIGFRCAADAR